MFGFIKRLKYNRRMIKEMKESSNEWLRDEERFKKLKREEFPLVEDSKLLQAAIAWVYEKTRAVEPSRHLEILSTLPKPCQNIIAVNAVDGEVNNGGFNQYYFNESHILTVSASEALLAISAPKLAEIAKKADLLYSQIKDQLSSIEENTLEEFFDSYEDNPLNELDDEYCNTLEIEPIDELLVGYIKTNIGCFGD